MNGKILIRCFAILLTSLTFVQCKSYFSCLPDNLVDSKNVAGMYENAAVISPFGSRDLWQCIDRRSKIQNDSHFVYLYFKKKNLRAQLIKGNQVVDQKKIRGTLTDSCFLARKNYLVVPILPILWFYNHQQIRISSRTGSLIVDEFTENGGAFIIMAGSNTENKTFEYRRIQDKHYLDHINIPK